MKEVRILAKDERGKVATRAGAPLPEVVCGGRAATLGSLERSANGDSLKSYSRAPQPISAEPTPQPMGGAASGRSLSLNRNRFG